jgi:1-aminocyclopropane-1-carboxylate deaminase/D-cysteine desulfhydrase-like pyridoxal-dependent ACC family enzyme
VTPHTYPAWERADWLWAYRGDHFEIAGVRGGKVRACWELVKQCGPNDRPGLVTAGSRHSPQVEIVAALGHAAAIPVRAYVPSGPTTEALENAYRLGAELVEVRPGYNGVIRARARQWAEAEGWQHVPFGMECREAVEQARAAVLEAGVPPDVTRLVVPVGSGMSLAGIRHGLDDLGRHGLEVLGVVVGADPQARLDAWAPAFWRMNTTLEPALQPYQQSAPPEHLRWCGLDLDAVYEAKCVPFLEEGDGLWIVGRRGVVGYGR